MDSKNLAFLNGKVRIVLTEWVPIGAHFIYTLQKKLRCHQSAYKPGVKGTSSGRNFYITKEIDQLPNAAVIESGKTEISMRVIDYKHMEYIRLESNVDIAETGGDLQSEIIGIEISSDGKISYGIELEGRQSLDDISHIIADLIVDSSKVMNTLFNSYQRKLLDIVFCHESLHRDKSLVIIAEKLENSGGKSLSMNDALSDDGYSAELTQVLGHLDIISANTLCKDEFIITGEHGMLLISADSAPLENFLVGYSMMNCIIMFTSNLQGWISWSWDCLNDQEKIIRRQDSEEIMHVQLRLSELSAEQVLLISVPESLTRDKEAIDSWIKSSDIAKTAENFNIEQYGYIRGLFDNLDQRLSRTERSIRTLGEEINNIRALASTLSEKATFRINEAMRVLTVFSVIFLPLTLIAGIYGMNFQAFRDPAFIIRSWWNMPELYWVYGYPFVLILMAVITLVLMVYFRKVGLLSPGYRINKGIGDKKGTRRRFYRGRSKNSKIP